MTGALTNHLWQSTIFAAAAGLLTLGFRKNRAQVRYWLWFCASAKFLVPFALFIALGTLLPKPTAQPASQAPVTVALVQITEPFPAAPPSTPNKGIEWIDFAAAGVWFCGFAALVAVRLRGWRRIRDALAAASPLELFLPVEVRSAPGLLEPGVVGWLRPVLLLPAGITERLSAVQLEAVMAHELCHVRRRDNLFAALHMAVEAVFWFHPLVWWIGARMVEERERACDEAVLTLGSTPRDYADGILNVCKLYVESPLACVSGVTGADLKKRIEAIMTNRLALHLNVSKKIALGLAALAAIVLPVFVGMLHVPAVRAQSAPAVRPKFEVASIKRCEDALVQGARGGAANSSPGRISISCQSVTGLIQEAYVLFASGKPPDPLRMTPVTMEGLPGWAGSERYAINAVAEDKTAGQLVMQGPMLQTLLEDRFKVKAHHESREVPAYNLVVAKNGPKLKPFQEGSCEPQPPINLSRPPEPPPALPAGQHYCAMRGGMVRGQANVVVDADGITLEDFAKIFLRPGPPGSRPVYDKTRLAGKFTIHLEYAASEETRQRMVQVTGNDLPEPTAPELSTAIQEQLGLRLEATKGSADFLVVDHVERPTEN